jgi:phosphatidylglycerophosphate synthase
MRAYKKVRFDKSIMRSSDAATLLRATLALLIVYMVLIKLNPLITITVIIITFLSDGIDGYLAVRDESNGSIGFITYLRASVGDKKARSLVKKVKSGLAKHAQFGARIDVAADRVVEFSFWTVFTYLGIIPLFVFLAVIVRHAFVDALMGAHGTSSKMHTTFSRIFYSSNASRAAINVLKITAFSYLTLVYVWNYPIIIGYVIVAMMFALIMLRGAAEVYEAYASYSD